MYNKQNMSSIRRIAISICIGVFILSAIMFLSIILIHSFGYYQEGLAGFICDIISRIFIIVIAFIALAVGYFVREKRKVSIIWWFCIIIACVGSFYLIRAPILDISYINNPESLKLDYVSFENDINHEYSVHYRLTGYTENNETKVFEINSKTYDKEKEKWRNNENVLADVKYLPHTNVLMELNTSEESSIY